MLRVGEPKGIMADTLLKAISEGGEEAVMTKYKQITTTADSSTYHIGQDRIWDALNKADQHKQAAQVLLVLPTKPRIISCGIKWFFLLKV
jgi:hypothetical protein